MKQGMHVILEFAGWSVFLLEEEKYSMHLCLSDRTSEKVGWNWILLLKFRWLEFQSKNIIISNQMLQFMILLSYYYYITILLYSFEIFFIKLEQYFGYLMNLIYISSDSTNKSTMWEKSKESTREKLFRTEPDLKKKNIWNFCICHWECLFRSQSAWEIYLLFSLCRHTELKSIRQKKNTANCFCGLLRWRLEYVFTCWIKYF